VLVKEHSEFPRLLKAMDSAVRNQHPWNGTIFRSAPPKWATSRAMLSGAGSMNSGARFNAPGSFPAIYGSTTPELAIIESLAYQRRANLPVEQALPLVFKAFSVNVAKLLDLSDAAVLASLKVSLDELRSEKWWLSRAEGEESLTQAIGRAAHLHRAQAILAPSAHTLDHGVNIIIFTQNMNPPSNIKILRGTPKTRISNRR
jgi:RES domain-containing protein